MKLIKPDIRPSELAYAQECARRAQELFPHLGVTIRWLDDEREFLLEVSDWTIVEQGLLTPLYKKFREELKTAGKPFDVVFTGPDDWMLQIQEPIGYLPPLAMAA